MEIIGEPEKSNFHGVVNMNVQSGTCSIGNEIRRNDHCEYIYLVQGVLL